MHGGFADDSSDDSGPNSDTGGGPRKAHRRRGEDQHEKAYTRSARRRDRAVPPLLGGPAGLQENRRSSRGSKAGLCEPREGQRGDHVPEPGEPGERRSGAGQRVVPLLDRAVYPGAQPGRNPPRLEGVEVVVPVRKTFYGANEIAVREPAGNVIIFAA